MTAARTNILCNLSVIKIIHMSLIHADLLEINQLLQ